MSDDSSEPRVQDLQRELAHAEAALRQPGSGALGTLECRVADLQQRLLTTPARSLGDVEARLEVIRDLVASLGEPGYLLHLVDATLADLRALAATEAQAGSVQSAAAYRR